VEITARKENRPAHKSPLTLLRPFLQTARYYLGPLDLPLYEPLNRQMIEESRNPDLCTATSRLECYFLSTGWIEIGYFHHGAMTLPLHAHGSWLIGLTTRTAPCSGRMP